MQPGCESSGAGPGKSSALKPQSQLGQVKSIIRRIKMSVTWNKVVGLCRSDLVDLSTLPDSMLIVPGYNGRFDEAPKYTPCLGDLIKYRKVSVSPTPHGNSYRIVSDIVGGEVQKARRWDGKEIPGRVFIAAFGTNAATLGELR